MSTYTQILYQVVFGTKNIEPTLIESGLENLYKYMIIYIELLRSGAIYLIKDIKLFFTLKLHPWIQSSPSAICRKNTMLQLLLLLPSASSSEAFFLAHS
jgi:hypothetical protein